MLTNSEIVRKVKGAFLPKRCAVEVRATESQLRLMVLDHNGGIIKVPTLVLANIRDERELDRALLKVRSRLEMKGHLIN